jgi:type VI protein secretion system component VasK
MATGREASLVALAAALGALMSSGLAHLWFAANTSTAGTNAQQMLQTVHAKLDQLASNKLDQLASIKGEHAELAALKANVDGATRSANNQFAKLADHIDRLERAQAEPATKIGQIAEAVDRLERRVPVNPETTGSIGGDRTTLTAETARAQPRATFGDASLRPPADVPYKSTAGKLQ